MKEIAIALSLFLLVGAAACVLPQEMRDPSPAGPHRHLASWRHAKVHHAVYVGRDGHDRGTIVAMAPAGRS